jgi:4-carboxymuconolactone decarboxylase
MHIHAALNVGCTPMELAEVIFQMATYGGVPVINTALKAFRDILQQRKAWPISKGE